MDLESSERLNLLRFPLIVGVVFVHGHETAVFFPGSTIGTLENGFVTEFVRNLISEGFARIAVPLFFLMSGYLFFAGVSWSAQKYVEKVKSRTRTLLIPFLFWNLAVLLLVALGQTIPETQGYFSGRGFPPIAKYDAIDYIVAIFGIGGRSPIAFQFWFIRDLMLLVLLTPVIFFLNRRAPMLFIGLLLLSWFTGARLVYSPEATLFFSVGSLLAIRNSSLFAADGYGKAFVVAYLIVLLADITFIGREWHGYLHRAGVVLGVVSCLYLTKHLLTLQPLRVAMLSLAGASFFVFAAHEPLLTAARKVVFLLVRPSSTYEVLGLYFAVPIMVIAGLVLVYFAMSARLPKLTRLVTGGR